MTLEQLRIFLAVAEREHVTSAARALNLTQSAASAAIAALERRYGAVLFDRVGRGVRLSEAGRRFRGTAASLVQDAEEAEHQLLDLGGRVGGTLRLQASQTVASYWLPQRLMWFRDAYPQVDLVLVQGNTTTVTQAVLDGEAEIGLIEGTAPPTGLESAAVAEDDIIVVVGERHPWADGRALAAVDLGTTTWVMRERGSGTRSVFEADIRAMGVDTPALQVVLELPSNEACLAAVAAGTSASAVSRRAARPHLGRGVLEAAFELPVRNFCALWHAQRYQTRTMKAMIEVLKGDPPATGTATSARPSQGRPSPQRPDPG